MNAHRILIAFNILLVAAMACNLQGPSASSAPNLVATITAQAMTLAAPVNTPVPQGKASPPQVSVTSVTNCRSGPSTAYALVITVNPGENLQLVGKDTADNYWIVTNPLGGTCWLWGQYAVINGDTSSLPEVPPPPAPTPKPTKAPKPTPVPSNTPVSGIIKQPPIIIATLILTAPAAPSAFSGSRTCSGAIGSDGFTPIWVEPVALTWHDNSNNEDGFHIFKNGTQIGNLPANSTQYNITLRYPTGTGGSLYDTFGIEAYNAFGASARLTWDVPKCP